MMTKKLTLNNLFKALISGCSQELELRTTLNTEEESILTLSQNDPSSPPVTVTFNRTDRPTQEFINFGVVKLTPGYTRIHFDGKDLTLREAEALYDACNNAEYKKILGRALGCIYITGAPDARKDVEKVVKFLDRETRVKLFTQMSVQLLKGKNPTAQKFLNNFIPLGKTKSKEQVEAEEKLSPEDRKKIEAAEDKEIEDYLLLINRQNQSFTSMRLAITRGARFATLADKPFLPKWWSYAGLTYLLSFGIHKVQSAEALANRDTEEEALLSAAQTLENIHNQQAYAENNNWRWGPLNVIGLILKKLSGLMTVIGLTSDVPYDTYNDYRNWRVLNQLQKKIENQLLDPHVPNRNILETIRINLYNKKREAMKGLIRTLICNVLLAVGTLLYFSPLGLAIKFAGASLAFAGSLCGGYGRRIYNYKPFKLGEPGINISPTVKSVLTIIAGAALLAAGLAAFVFALPWIAAASPGVAILAGFGIGVMKLFGAGGIVLGTSTLLKVPALLNKIYDKVYDWVSPPITQINPISIAVPRTAVSPILSSSPLLESKGVISPRFEQASLHTTALPNSRSSTPELRPISVSSSSSKPAASSEQKPSSPITSTISPLLHQASSSADPLVSKSPTFETTPLPVKSSDALSPTPQPLGQQESLNVLSSQIRLNPTITIDLVDPQPTVTSKPSDLKTGSTTLINSSFHNNPTSVTHQSLAVPDGKKLRRSASHRATSHRATLPIPIPIQPSPQSQRSKTYLSRSMDHSNTYDLRSESPLTERLVQDPSPVYVY